ncbi:hypothetical protein Tco_1432254 [Tanacetum coccineum]
MAKQVELNKQKGEGTGQGENRPVWNNVQRLNHQNYQAVSTSAARKVNAVRPIVNDVNTAGDKAVSAVGGIRETTVKPSAGCDWRSKRHYWNKFSNYNGGSNSRKYVKSEDPLGRPKPKMAWVPKRN